MKIKLMTEYVKNGIYHRELVEYTEEEYNKMLHHNNNLGGKANVRKSKKRNTGRKTKSN